MIKIDKKEMTKIKWPHTGNIPKEEIEWKYWYLTHKVRIITIQNSFFMYKKNKKNNMENI